MGFYYDFEIVNLIGLSFEEAKAGIDLTKPSQLVVTDNQRVIDYCLANSMPVAAAEDADCTRGLKADFILADFEQIEDNEVERVYCRQRGLSWIPFESERFYFKELALSDVDALFDLYSKPHVTDYLEPLFEYEKELEYEANYIKYIYEFYNFGMWLVFDKKTNALVGRAGLESRENCQSDELELGFIVAPEFQRQGYATEICNAILDYAINWLEIDRFISRCDPKNLASRALLSKLGFVAEDDLLEDGDMLWKKG